MEVERISPRSKVLGQEYIIKSNKKVVISTETQWNGGIYLEIDFSTALHSARNDGEIKKPSSKLTEEGFLYNYNLISIYSKLF
ncbi:hypothetical protein GCM10022289_32170 [Pedobacter jeongneungensis]|uniref:Uncharacterized protein n=1 Tax=Pedobacter jeongneungensis TaxID=947309 RepID=A0ABP8BK41_9SPHI